MKRVLIIGNAPLPTENTKSRPAAGLRTYQFIKPLLKKGGINIKDAAHAFASEKRQHFSICLINIAMPECYDHPPKRKLIRHSDDYLEYTISKNDADLTPYIQSVCDEFHPEVIVSINTFPSYIASKINCPAPMWADLNGWIMSEAQAQAFKTNSNDYLSHYYSMEKSILRRADKISTVSKPQLFSVMGELAFWGRLNKESFGYQFAHHIPNGTEYFDSDCVSVVGEKGKPPFYGANLMDILSESVPRDAFVALWLGGYNTWVDEITLFKGLIEAMEKCKDLYFVSTGGDIKGLDNKTFAKFKELIDKSEYKDRFVFLGWLPTCDIPYIYSRANVGLNVDRKCMETFTGARNRINEMMKFGLPVITTLGSEISNEVASCGSGIVIESGKYEELSEAICIMNKEWTNKTVKYREFKENGQKYIDEMCNYTKLQKPLIDWLENPRPAPDRGLNINLESKFGFLVGGFKYFRERGIKNGISKAFQKLRNRF